ncbi:MAG: nuclear transport factor 2 family protein [Tannerella sp.]|nr:nuclear transport factor 2 family protein [Tannerella sp.]
MEDRIKVSELLSRYCRIIDDKKITEEAIATIFAHEGRYIKPNGATAVGPKSIAEEESKVFSRFRGTHHITSDHIVDFEGDTAYLTANMTAMHLWAQGEGDPFSTESYFQAGGIFSAKAVMTDDGWRFSELSTRIVWRTGAGITFMAKVNKKD